MYKFNLKKEGVFIIKKCKDKNTVHEFKLNSDLRQFREIMRKGSYFR